MVVRYQADSDYNSIEFKGVSSVIKGATGFLVYFCSQSKFLAEERSLSTGVGSESGGASIEVKG